MNSVRRIVSRVLVVALILAGLAGTHALNHHAAASMALSSDCQCPPDAGCNPDACSLDQGCGAMCGNQVIADLSFSPVAHVATTTVGYGTSSAYTSVARPPLLPPPTA
ncbi:MAG: hypothetical protein EXR11_04580 [Rhodospirillaceae bacterium]|nr:hypothetical protein [Rhodospirillaceae bacterium]